MPSAGILSLCRIDEHRKGLSVLLNEIERQFVEEAVHRQQRREVGFVKNAARDVQELMQSLADEVIGRIPGPAAKGLVRFGDATVSAKREVPAGRILVEVSQIRFEMVRIRQNRAAPKTTSASSKASETWRHLFWS